MYQGRRDRYFCSLQPFGMTLQPYGWIRTTPLLVGKSFTTPYMWAVCPKYRWLCAKSPDSQTDIIDIFAICNVFAFCIFFSCTKKPQVPSPPIR